MKHLWNHNQTKKAEARDTYNYTVIRFNQWVDLNFSAQNL